MKRRTLHDEDGTVLGQVELSDSGALTLTGGSVRVFRNLKKQLGDKLGDQLLEKGWSNGYLYLGPVEEK